MPVPSNTPKFTSEFSNSLNYYFHNYKTEENFPLLSKKEIRNLLELLVTNSAKKIRIKDFSDKVQFMKIFEEMQIHPNLVIELGEFHNKYISLRKFGKN